MPAFAKIEDAPHHLKRLDDYGKNSVTISIALLSLSAAFVEKLLKPPVGWPPFLLLLLLWLSLLAILILGLLINGSLAAVASNYAKAKNTAYPDALQRLAEGEKIKLQEANEDIEVTDPVKRDQIKESLKKSSERAAVAYSYAQWSFFLIAFSGLLIVVLGLYQSIRLSNPADAASAINTSVEFVTKVYKLKADESKFHAVSFDEKTKSFLIEILNTQPSASKPTASKYEVTINGDSGEVKKAQDFP